MLFGMFQERPRWSIKLLRVKTQQPEVYLKEVLSEVAILHRSGEYNGLWELKDVYKGDGVSVSLSVGILIALTCTRSKRISMPQDRARSITEPRQKWRSLRRTKKTTRTTRTWKRCHDCARHDSHSWDNGASYFTMYMHVIFSSI
jgi:hypothetical protein